jgi:cbb3-type cytochrome oxidase maturation protein
MEYMKVILLLIAISLLIALGFLISFFWAVKSGQYDDDYTPSVRILFDDDPTISIKNENNSSTT